MNLKYDYIDTKVDVFQEDRFYRVKGEGVCWRNGVLEPQVGQHPAGTRMPQLWLSVTQSQDTWPAGPRPKARPSGFQMRGPRAWGLHGGG